ncbi:MAG: DUF6113 family protein [Mycobacteriales bacterium]
MNEALAHRVLRTANGVVVAGIAALTALVEAFFVVFRVGAHHAPVSLAAAVVLNPLLTWAMWKVTDSRWAMVVPTALWMVVVVPLGLTRPEGDFIVTGDSWGLMFFLGGPLAGGLGLAYLIPRTIHGPAGPGLGGAARGRAGATRPVLPENRPRPVSHPVPLAPQQPAQQQDIQPDIERSGYGMGNPAPTRRGARDPLSSPANQSRRPRGYEPPPS